MDPLAVAAFSFIALAGSGTGAHWRCRARRAEAQTVRLRHELAAERHAACHDPLTGLPNRRAFYQLGSASITDHTQYSLVVVVVDLDDFKQINDEYGHDAGDQVLIHVARRFTDYAGDNLVARLGGDEFVGLLTSPTQDAHWQHLVARTLSQILAAPMQIAGRSLVVTASVGLAPVNASVDLADAVRRADAAMYCAKPRYRGTPSWGVPARAGLPVAGQPVFASQRTDDGWRAQTAATDPRYSAAAFPAVSSPTNVGGLNPNTGVPASAAARNLR